MSATSKKMSVIAIAAIFFLLDRLVKLLFLNYYHKLEFKIFGDYLELKLAFNSGIAFSLPLSQWLIIITTSLILIVLIFVAVQSYQKDKLGIFSAWLMLIAGAASNLSDRINYGAVVDYFDVRYFTIFNLADVAITLSIAYLLLVLTLRKPSDNPKA